MNDDSALHLLQDQGMPRDTAVILRSLGYSCHYVGEIEMAKAKDTEILVRAGELRAVIATIDADFHSLLAVTGASGFR